jgi:signal transduction histidine kinase
MSEPDRDLIEAILPAHRRRWLVVAIYAAAGGAFLTDVLSSQILACGLAYIPLVCTAMFHRNPRVVWLLAGVTSAMVVAGFFLPHINTEYVASAIDRVLTLLAIAITAVLVRHERHVRDRLIEQRERAQAAERAKAYLLSNFSHELRTPLSAILGFSDLLLADCRADQQSALGHISAGGKRLLRTLENLIELSRIDERQLQPQEIDLTRLLRQLADAAQPEAAEQQIALAFAAVPALLVSADPAALRRILDNLIANAIKFTDAGGSIDVTVAATPDGVTATVRDTGIGMPREVLDALGTPFFQGDSSATRRYEGMGTGLALSMRLAGALSARLVFESAPGQGTTVHLRLPSPTSPATSLQTSPPVSAPLATSLPVGQDVQASR